MNYTVVGVMPDRMHSRWRDTGRFTRSRATSQDVYLNAWMSDVGGVVLGYDELHHAMCPERDAE